MIKIKLISKTIDKFYLYSLFRKQLTRNFLLSFFTKFNLIFLYYDKFLVRSFNSLLEMLLYGLIKGYKSYIILKGAGYRFKVIDTNNHFGLIIRLGYSHLIYISLINNFRLNLISKLTLIFYSNNLLNLKNKSHCIKLKKKLNSYKKKGIVLKNHAFLLKKSSKLKF